MIRTLAGLLLIGCCASAQALDANDAGLFVALNQQGQPVEKIVRVTRTATEWMFEDRQPDGTWLDVSCHGGCQHRPSTREDLVRFFGSAPPQGLTPDCIQNEQYGFCHFVTDAQYDHKEGYVLVVRIKDNWLPVTLARLPATPSDEDEPEDPDSQEGPDESDPPEEDAAPALESASL